MQFEMEDFAAYSQIANRVEVNGGDIHDRDDVMDAVVNLSCNHEHFTDEELNEIADIYFEMQALV